MSLANKPKSTYLRLFWTSENAPAYITQSDLVSSHARSQLEAQIARVRSVTGQCSYCADVSR